MIKVEFTQNHNIQAPDFSKKELPVFAVNEPDISEIKKFAEPLLKYKNVIICGRGGSVTSFVAYFGALAKFETKKNVHVVDTVDPDYLNYVKENCKTAETIVIVISKSGTTIDVIENYVFFSKYKCVFVVTPGDNTLANIAKINNIAILPHPEVGGRYSGLTATALLPACLVGIDIERLWQGAKKAYQDFAPSEKNNLALMLASFVFENDKKGKCEIYLPIYSKKLVGFSELVMQLIHESWGKQGKGATIVPVDAPESQHHSNQRFFGGRKNMQGLFLKLENFEKEITLVVDKKIKSVTVRDGNLESLDKLSLTNSMLAEFIGNYEDIKKRGVAASFITLNKINAESIGYLTGFLHYLTVYLCWLENVNPFDQPEVESSKEISFSARLKR